MYRETVVMDTEESDGFAKFPITRNRVFMLSSFPIKLQAVVFVE